MNLQTLKSQLHSLRLKTAADEIDDILAKQKKAVSLSWAQELFERELDARKEKLLQARIKKAQFPEITSLETFDFSFNEKLEEEKIRSLFDLHFLNQNQIVLLLGSPGTGKTHIALALGIQAAEQGHRVFCTSVKRLHRLITTAKMKNTLDELFKKILSTKLLVLDDWGVISMSREIAEEIFDLLDRRKHSCSLILTSNRDIDEWPQVFPDPVLANAAIDRLFEKAEIILFEGPSYRLKNRIEMEAIDSTPKSH